MSDTISPVMPQNFAVPAIQTESVPSYATGEVNTLENVPYMDTFESSEEKHTARNVGLGILGVAALAALADGIFAKGKHLKKIGSWFQRDTKKVAEKAKEEAKTKPLEEKLNKLKEADTASGETIKDGVIFDTKGNKIRKVTEKDGNFKIEEFEGGKTSKIYEFQKEQLNLTEFDSNGRKVSSVITDAEDKIITDTKWSYHPSGKCSECTVDDSKFNKLQLWDEKGRIVHESLLDKEKDTKTVSDYVYSRFSSVKTTQNLDGNGNVLNESKEYTGLKKFFNSLKFWSKSNG